MKATSAGNRQPPWRTAVASEVNSASVAARIAAERLARTSARFAEGSRWSAWCSVETSTAARNGPSARLDHGCRAERQGKVDPRVDFLEELGLGKAAYELAADVSEDAIELSSRGANVPSTGTTIASASMESTSA